MLYNCISVLQCITLLLFIINIYCWLLIFLLSSLLDILLMRINYAFILYDRVRKFSVPTVEPTMLELLRSQALLLQTEREPISVHVKTPLIREPLRWVVSFTTGSVHPKKIGL